MQPDNLLLKLQNVANELLDAERVYSILDYGWEDAETPSSEYVGLAMWTTDAPFEPDFDLWFRTTPPAEPTEHDEIFYKSGEDFIGTMDVARHFIGLTRYAWEHRKPDQILDDEVVFWEHRATATLWLNIASDRIRDYFVMARFGMSAKQYRTLHKKNGIYARPFLMHSASEGEAARKVALELESHAEQLGEFRQARNEIVHSVASRQGHRSRDLVHSRDEAVALQSGNPEAYCHSYDHCRRKERSRRHRGGFRSCPFSIIVYRICPEPDLNGQVGVAVVKEQIPVPPKRKT